MFSSNCDIPGEVVNTGTEGNRAMGPTAMVLFGDTTVQYTLAQISNIAASIYATGKARVFSLFGNMVPIRKIDSAKSDNKIETLADGSMAFIQNGMYTQILTTKEGGECLGKVLFAMNGSNKGFMLVDQNNQIKCRKFANGKYGFLPANMIDAPLPDDATFDAVYKNNLRINYNPRYSIAESAILQADVDLLEIMHGLVNVYLSVKDKTETAKASTTTKIRVFAKDLCCDGNLAIDYATEIAVITNFSLTNAGIAVVPTGVVVVDNSGDPYLEFTTAAQASASTVLVSFVAASVLVPAGMYWEGPGTVAVVIP